MERGRAAKRARSATLADTFVVTTTGDHDDGTCDAGCTLREAIAAANAQPGDDIITFAAGVTGTIGIA